MDPGQEAMLDGPVFHSTQSTSSHFICSWSSFDSSFIFSWFKQTPNVLLTKYFDLDVLSGFYNSYLDFLTNSHKNHECLALCDSFLKEQMLRSMEELHNSGLLLKISRENGSLGISKGEINPIGTLKVFGVNGVDRTKNGFLHEFQIEEKNKGELEVSKIEKKDIDDEIGHFYSKEKRVQKKLEEHEDREMLQNRGIFESTTIHSISFNQRNSRGISEIKRDFDKSPWVLWGRRKDNSKGYVAGILSE